MFFKNLLLANDGTKFLTGMIPRFLVEKPWIQILTNENMGEDLKFQRENY